jgi:hypothetical protein
MKPSLMVGVFLFYGYLLIYEKFHCYGGSIKSFG